MDKGMKPLTDFLLGLGIEEVPHTGKTYLGHLIGVYRLMEAGGCDAEVCRAGMFHSIYGTQQFQGFKLPLERRPEVRRLIGERAERLAYLNCALDRASLDRATFDRAVERGEEPFHYRDRITGETFDLPRAEFDDLCRVHLYDWLEQVPRSHLGWDYRRPGYRGMAEWLGGAARESYDRVFAGERAGAG